MRLLLVEDEPSLRESVARKLHLSLIHISEPTRH